ncbi:MAG: hypothetical protein IT204_22190 [Fimbriimonadaceae bacterium]|nr:hypothetical protein [Fimbriimonadaceae bacterium]
MTAPRATTPIRTRALLLAGVLIPVNLFWVVAAEEFRKTGDPTTTSIFSNAVFSLLLLEFLNSLLQRWWPRAALHRLERLTVYSLVAAACGIASRDFIQVALPLWAHPLQHATPENAWQAKFIGEVPGGLIVTDPVALKNYFQGHSTLYTKRHLLAWALPVLNWSLFFSSIWLVMLALCVLLRQQWTERERLSFPILQVPLEITASGHDLWRQRAFWAGFWLAAAIDLLNGLNKFVPQVPLLKLKLTNLQPFFTTPALQKMGYTPISFFPFAIGLAFLLPTDLSFSCWFFYLFFKAQLAVGGWLGYEGSMGFEGKQGSMPFVAEQGIGAYLALGLFGLYMARDHLRGVLARARRPLQRDDRLARWALLALGVGLLHWVYFSVYCGFTWTVAVAYFGLYFLVTTTITKIRAELGPPVHDLHFGGPDRMLLTWLGVQGLRPADRIGFALFFGFNRAYRGVPQPMMLEAMRAVELENGSQTRLAWAFLLAGPLAAFGSCWAMLHWAYHDGMQFARESYRFGGQAWLRLDSWFAQPWPVAGGATAAMGVGAVGCLLLMGLRLRFLGFPFHPIGYAISANWAMNCVWMPILIGWAAKSLCLKYGGSRLYRQVLPAAIGLILGEFVVGSLWSLYGVATKVPVYSFWLFD